MEVAVDLAGRELGDGGGSVKGHPGAMDPAKSEVREARSVKEHDLARVGEVERAAGGGGIGGWRVAGGGATRGPLELGDWYNHGTGSASSLEEEEVVEARRGQEEGRGKQGRAPAPAAAVVGALPGSELGLGHCHFSDNLRV